MRERWRRDLERWRTAGILDEPTIRRIVEYEAASKRARPVPWLAIVALGFGALSLGAGVLLFVAAHWDALSPNHRFALVLSMVGLFHLGGALAAPRVPWFASALHATGTASLGAALYLTAQIFNLHENWTGGLFLWALGALLAWALLKSAPQAAFAAVLAPAWLVAERAVRLAPGTGVDLPAAQGLTLASIVYLLARLPEPDADDTRPRRDRHAATRRVLSIVGAIGLFPSVAYLFLALQTPWQPYGVEPSTRPVGPGELAAHAVAFALPLALGLVLRRRDAWYFVPVAVWVGTLSVLDLDRPRPLLVAWFSCFVAACALSLWGARDRIRAIERLGLAGTIASMLGLLVWATENETTWVFAACAALAAAVVASGVHLTKKDTINTGVLLFALTVAFFYFSAVMDKLGRSLSLIGLGVVFLGGGYLLERARRRLVAAVEASAP
ncbi:MAG TPA: DUF2157 domain-containing protein [Polyangiaceae bacterium]|nr:DUF2157 domain-containing protein [Polyangiaceae bacterium]